MTRHITIVINIDDQAAINLPDFDTPLFGGRITGMAAYSSFQTEEIAIKALERLEHEAAAVDALTRINAVMCGQDLAE